MKTSTNLMAAALLAALAAGQAAPASAAITNKAECYTAVTNACNKKKNPDAVTACNNNGHDQCDKQFGTKAQIDRGTVNGLTGIGSSQRRN